MLLNRVVVAALPLGLLAGTAIGQEERIVFVSQAAAGAERDIYSVRPDGTGLMLLTGDTDGDADFPNVSPDGRRIGYSKLDTDGWWQLWVMDSDGSDKRQLTDVEWAGGPYAWPWLDNSRLMYRFAPAPSIGDIRTIDVDTFADELLLPSSAVGEASIDQVDLNTSRTMLAFIAQAGSWNPTTDVYITDLSTMESTVLYADDDDNYLDMGPLFIGHSDVAFMHVTCPAVCDISERELRVKNTLSPSAANQVDRIDSTDFTGCAARAASPDGAWLLYSCNGQLYTVRNTATGAETPFADLGLDTYIRAEWAVVDMTCGPADLAEPVGVLDLRDVTGFIDSFTAGCP